MLTIHRNLGITLSSGLLLIYLYTYLNNKIGYK